MTTDHPSYSSPSILKKIYRDIHENRNSRNINILQNSPTLSTKSITQKISKSVKNRLNSISQSIFPDSPKVIRKRHITQLHTIDNPSNESSDSIFFNDNDNYNLEKKSSIPEILKRINIVPKHLQYSSKANFKSVYKNSSKMQNFHNESTDERLFLDPIAVPTEISQNKPCKSKIILKYF